jgi:stage II sporulation protein D
MIKNSKSKHDNADICDDPSCCQAWISKDDRFARWEEDKREENWKKIEDAVYSTQGEIITYDGNPIEAFFHSNSGGKTEEVSNVWGGTDLPYLQSVETAGEDAYSQYASEVNISKEEFEKKMKEKYANFSIDYSLNDCIKVTEYTDGNRVKTIKIGNENISGVEIRTIIGLKSANFSVEINGDMINFKVKGYGHGVRNEPNWS